MPNKDYYATLGVDKNASQDEIKRAYLQNLRIEKSENSITTKQYYSQQDKDAIQETQIQNSDADIPTQHSWIFNPAD